MCRSQGGSDTSADRGGLGTEWHCAESYVWEAMGDALDSVARYWLATFVAGLTGPRFPVGHLANQSLGLVHDRLVRHLDRQP